MDITSFHQKTRNVSLQKYTRVLKLALRIVDFKWFIDLFNFEIF
jgi:hypothetical protein